ncbi:MAG TPA: HAD-IA family hydrolase [Candidatus Saccharimonadales bacterium]|nr:HAD-IA family hydrolase [Candidatus Saccharimonadales bacterium]
MGEEEKALGQRLAGARRKAGLTQQELCQKAGLSYSTLAKIERGAIKAPSVFTVAAIAAATGVPLEELLDMASLSPAKSGYKTSKSGVKFVYMDVGGTMKRPIHKNFTDIAEECGEPVDVVEILFWRHHDAVASGKLSLADFNQLMGQELGLKNFDWLKHYVGNSEPMPHVKELVEWISANYRLGLLSNNFPGAIDGLLRDQIIPRADYAVIVDSSKVGFVKPDPKIYELATDMAGVKAHEVLFIDNERPNITAADQAGWQVLWFDETDPEKSVARIKDKLAF